MINSRVHPTQFMVDLVSLSGGTPTLESFAKRENGYDESFCFAWKKILRYKNTSILEPSKFLAFMDDIQRSALKHRPKIILCAGGYLPIHGRGTLNFYCFNKGLVADERGLIDIIQKIWIHKEPFHLSAVDDQKSLFVLTNENLSVIPASSSDQFCLIENEKFANSQSLNDVLQVFVGLFNANPRVDGKDRFKIFDSTSVAEKEIRARTIINNYCASILEVQSKDEKVKQICLFMRDLMQLHLYYDGNGRTLYMLANLLLLQNNIQPFYPINMCIFDANSLERMVEEVTLGQQRLIDMFGNIDELSQGLESYGDALEKLKLHVNKNYPSSSTLTMALNDRNFNLLFRKSAAEVKEIKLLELLLDNQNSLNIDPLSRGTKSGNALEIAQACQNSEAVILLKTRVRAFGT